MHLAARMVQNSAISVLLAIQESGQTLTELDKLRQVVNLAFVQQCLYRVVGK